MPYTLEDARAAVAKGVKMLDEKKPGWRDVLAPQMDNFNIASPCRCVLGLVYGSFGRGLGEILWDSERSSASRMEFAEEHGWVSFRGDNCYSLLDQAWREELTKERPAG